MVSNRSSYTGNIPPPYSNPPQQQRQYQEQQRQQQLLAQQRQQQQQMQQQQQRQYQQQQQQYSNRSSSQGYSQYPQPPNGYGGGPGQGYGDPRRSQSTVSYPTQQPASQPQQHPSGRISQGTRCYRAMYDYESQDVDEVSFKDGDIIINATFIDEGWMTGTVHRTGQAGMLPANYVEPVNL